MYVFRAQTANLLAEPHESSPSVGSFTHSGLVLLFQEELRGTGEQNVAA